MSGKNEKISSNPEVYKGGQRPNTRTRRDIKKMTTDRVNPNNGPKTKSAGKSSMKIKQ